MSIKNREQIISNGQSKVLKKIREDVIDILESALESVNPYSCVKNHIDGSRVLFDSEEFDVSSFQNVYLVGFGKASVGMAQAVCDSFSVKEGVVVTNEPDNCVDDESVLTVVGGHPIPDSGSIEGAEKIVDLVEKCGSDDLLFVLISGGGSALLARPRVSLDDLKKVTDLLLKSGADINEINTVRKHLSKVKGGQLAVKCKGVMVSFIISDIVGDPLSFIASGPTVGDSTSFSDGKKVLEKYNIWDEIPDNAQDIIRKGVDGIIADTPDDKSDVFKDVYNFIVANNKIACLSAQKCAKNLGYDTLVVTTSLEGEARDMGVFLAGKAMGFDKCDEKDRRCCFISGGETTVTIHGEGRGGRNQEMVLGVVKEISESDLVFASFATDGVDGMSDAAGAIADGDSLTRAGCFGLNPDSFLEENNSYEFFKKIGDLFFTGPTGTNVMDIQIVIRN